MCAKVNIEFLKQHNLLIQVNYCAKEFIGKYLSFEVLLLINLSTVVAQFL